MKILDTSVIVDIDRGGVEERVSKLDDEGRHAMSVVTLTELRLGVENQYEPKTKDHVAAVEALDRLCARFELLEITRPIGVKAAEIIADLQARGEQLDDLHDVYIAASASTIQVPVLTANVDHFDRIDDIEVVDWGSY